jgi:hypothetical protein
MSALATSKFKRAQHTQQKLPIQTTMTAKVMNAETVQKLTDAAMALVQNDRIIAETRLQVIKSEEKLREKSTQQAQTVAAVQQQAAPPPVEFTTTTTTINYKPNTGIEISNMESEKLKANQTINIDEKLLLTPQLLGGITPSIKPKPNQDNKNNSFNNDSKERGKIWQQQKHHNNKKSNNEYDKMKNDTGTQKNLSVHSEYYLLLLKVVPYVYYGYSYLLNNIMYSNITLIIFLYYVAVSMATKLPKVDYCSVLQKWWSEHPSINLRTRKKQKHQRRWRFLPTTSPTGHRPETHHPRFRRTRSGDGCGKTQCNCNCYCYYYFHYIYKLWQYKSKPVRRVSSRKFHECTSTCTPNNKSFGTTSTDNISTATCTKDNKSNNIDFISHFINKTTIEKGLTGAHRNKIIRTNVKTGVQSMASEGVNTPKHSKTTKTIQQIKNSIAPGNCTAFYQTKPSSPDRKNLLQSEGATQYLFQNEGAIQYEKAHQEYLLQNEGDTHSLLQNEGAIQYENKKNKEQAVQVPSVMTKQKKSLKANEKESASNVRSFCELHTCHDLYRDHSI